MIGNICFNLKILYRIVLYLIGRYYIILFIMQIFIIFISASRQIVPFGGILGPVLLVPIVGFFVFLFSSVFLLIVIAVTMNADFRREYVLASRNGEVDRLLLTIFHKE